MERWNALMPDRAAGPGAGPANASSASRRRPHLRTARGLIPLPLPPSRHDMIGPLTPDAWITVMHFLPVPDIPQLALCNRKLNRLAKDDRVWRVKLAWLNYQGPGASQDWRQKRSAPADTDKTTLATGKADGEGARDRSKTITPATAHQGAPEPEPYRDDPAAADDDGFGAFQDGDLDRNASSSSQATEDPFGFSNPSLQPPLAAGSSASSRSAASPSPSRPPPGAMTSTGRPQPAADDLLLLFEDEADGVLAAQAAHSAGGRSSGSVQTSIPAPGYASSTAPGHNHLAPHSRPGTNPHPRYGPPPPQRPAVSTQLTFGTVPTLRDTSPSLLSTTSGGSFSFSQGTISEESLPTSTGGTGTGTAASPGLKTTAVPVDATSPVDAAGLSLASPTGATAAPAAGEASLPLLSIYQQHLNLLLPFYTSLQTQSTSSLVFTVSPPLSPLLRARLLACLARFTHPLLAPTRSRPQRLTVQRNVQSAVDFYESTLLAEFEKADQGGFRAGGPSSTAAGVAAGASQEDPAGGRDEEAMKETAMILWELNQSSTLSQVFVQKRETLFGQNHDPLRNLVKIEKPDGTVADGIDFSAMDQFMASTLSVLRHEGSLIARVFPPEADVLLYFLERIANDVVSDYITSLLAAAQPLQNPLFLLATAATFGQVYRLVDCVLEIEPRNERLTKERAEDVIFKVFEPLMDDYLSEEGEWIRHVLEGICEEWDRKTAHDLAVSDPTFLASQNPAQVKRNVLAGFTKVLLLPVTIIPKTAEFGLNAITYGATGVIDTFASLGNQLSSAATPSTPNPPQRPQAGEKHRKTPSTFEAVISEKSQASASTVATIPVESSAHAWGGEGVVETDVAPGRLSVDANGHIGLAPQPSADTGAQPPPVPGRFDRLQFLLSLDTALQLIQADRDSLKRIQTFIRYPGLYGRKVRDAIEEVFLGLLQVLSEKHVCPAFAQATQQMAAYRPADHDDEGIAVAPLVQFFELVHIGDTIQQMVDVYFEKEMATYINRRDFLNAVVREKKKFESALDDAVAQGLNAAVNMLMASVEHLITVRQGLRDFTPDRDNDFDLMPTRACSEVIRTLTQHCDMLRGSTDKQILEVFNQEVGIRLHGIILKHLKRQIVSTQGGLQLIADLNAYHAFVSTLRQPQVTAYFTSLKMVGELFLIDDPKEIGALVRDTSRYEGTLSQEDLYELVQRRADWQKIERLVDKAVYGLECILS